jgi:hypothetical protein
MTLCISYQFKSPNDSISRAICYSDSLITTTGAITDQAALKTFLPSDTEIKHRTDKGIKIQIVSASSEDGAPTHDFIFSIAGAVSLGLQSLIHLESVFKIFYEKCSFEEYLRTIETVLNEFWEDARDKDIEYLITTVDDSKEVRIIHVKGGGSESSLVFEEIQKEGDLLLAVIGDNADEARNKILNETHALLYAGYEVFSALDIACLRMIRRAVEDPEQEFIGGNIQSCMLTEDKAQYIVLDNGSHLLFRGIKYPRGHHEYPRRLNQLVDKKSFLVSHIYQNIFNPDKSIQDLIEEGQLL